MLVTGLGRMGDTVPSIPELARWQHHGALGETDVSLCPDAVLAVRGVPRVHAGLTQQGMLLGSPWNQNVPPAAAGRERMEQKREWNRAN